MQSNALATERFVVAGLVSPAARSATEHLSAAIDMGQYHSLMGIVLAGVLGTNATATGAFKASDASAGSYDDTVKSASALVKATDDDKQAVINLKAEELADGDRYVKGSLTIGTNTSDAAMLILGEKREGPEVANALMSERVAVLSVIDPDVYPDGTENGGEWADMTKFRQLLVVLMSGTLGVDVSATVTFEQAKDSDGTGNKAISGKTITLGASDDDTTSSLALRDTDLDLDNGYGFVKAFLTIDDTSSPQSATGGAAVVVLGVDPKEMPASDYDLASVKQIVA